MGITSISLNKQDYESLGLGPAELPLDSPLSMRSLGNVVLLAGPNGAGKSRFLRMIPKLVQKHLSPEARELASKQIDEYAENISIWEEQVRILEISLSSDPSNLKLVEELKEARRRLAENMSVREGVLRQLELTELATLADGSLPYVIDFVPRTAALANPALVVDRDVSARSSRMRELGNLDAEENAPAYLREVMKAAVLAKIGKISGKEAEDAERDETELRALLSGFLGARVPVTLDKSFNLVVDGVQLDTRGLSQGQQILFQFACMLHAQGAQLKECIVLMDEPENHLHPQIVIEVIDQVLHSLGAGQLWISTHSVPLIAHLVAANPECLWLVEDGHVKSAGRSPERVLHSLMGGADGSKNLHEFTMLPTHYAALRFIAQCLEPPGVVGPDVKDPQTMQISQILTDRVAHAMPLRVLDFGAGKARLLATLAAEHQVLEDPKELETWLDYFAYDIDAENLLARKNEVIAAYGEAQAVKRLLNSRGELTSRMDSGSVDVVVMCNVLHEISPSDWPDLFGPSGYLTALLKPNGMLLLVEDYGIPVGEKAHRYGFLLLDEPELVKLFDVREADRERRRFVRQSSQERRYKDRLVAHLIGQECLLRMSAATREQAIGALENRMSSELDVLLQQPGPASSENGRSYARTTQLLANAHVWLKGNSSINAKASGLGTSHI